MPENLLKIGEFSDAELIAMADMVKEPLLRHTVQLFTGERNPEPEA